MEVLIVRNNKKNIRFIYVLRPRKEAPWIDPA